MRLVLGTGCYVKSNSRPACIQCVTNPQPHQVDHHKEEHINPTKGLSTLSQSLTDLVYTHAADGQPPIHHDFLTKLLSRIFLENKAFLDDPEWGKQQIFKLTGLLMDAYMEGYAQA